MALTPTQLRRNISRNSRNRARIIEGKAQDLADIFGNAQDQILRLLLNRAAGPKITPVRAEALMADIDRIVRDELTAPGTAWVRAEVPELYNLGVTHAARAATAMSGFTSFNAIPDQRVRQIFLTFTETPTYGAILDEGFRRWLGAMQSADAAMVTGIRDALTQGSILGLPNGEIVNLLVKDGALKPIMGANGVRISAEDRARAIVRTEGIRSVVQTEVASARATGLEAFIDIGVRDETTSGECTVAQRQPPRTLGWWSSSPMGVPPRHVANCRDELIAVDLKTFTAADARAFGIVGYDPATYELDIGQISEGETRRLRKEIAEADAKQKRNRAGLREKGLKVGTR